MLGFVVICYAEVVELIVYKVNILKALSEAGYNTNRIRKEKVFPEGVLTKFRHNGGISTMTLDRLCSILKCQPGDLIKWIEDGQDD